MTSMKQYKSVYQNKNVGFIIPGLLMAAFFLMIVDAQSQPSKNWVAPTTASQIKNPLAGEARDLKDAQKLYVTYCTPCHGNKGKGDGIASASLNPKPADHTSAMVQKESDGALYWKLTEGHAPMPSYKQILADNQRWELVNFIRSLARKK